MPYRGGEFLTFKTRIPGGSDRNVHDTYVTRAFTCAYHTRYGRSENATLLSFLCHGALSSSAIDYTVPVAGMHSASGDVFIAWQYGITQGDGTRPVEGSTLSADARC